MSGRFTDKVMVVTGAAQGIGLRVAERAANEGARLVLIDRAPHITDVAATLAPAEALALIADFEDYAVCAQTLREVQERMGRIDILINNIGGTIWVKPYEHYSPSEIQAEIQRSLFPTLWACHAALPYMIAQGAGVIVNVSSIATRGMHRAPYGAAKGGINALTACLAFENAQRGLRVNAVAAGGTDAPPRRVPRNSSEQNEQEKIWYQQIVDQTVDSSLMKRYGTLDEQAAAILFLASEEASYITGTVLPVGGGDQG